VNEFMGEEGAWDMSRTQHSNSLKASVQRNQLDLFGSTFEAQVESRRVVAKKIKRAKTAPAESPSAAQLQAPNAKRDVDQRLVDFVMGAQERRGRPPKILRAGEEGPTDERRLLDVREAAARLGLSKSTLDKMRCSGRGPRFIRATDRAIRYDPEDLKAFADERRQRSTSHILESLNA
jgi:predicted DNA-binding transcriptional regulator AlpA